MKTILLVGSSIFEQWSNMKDFAPGYTVKNRAIGGTITSYWMEHLADVLTAESPDTVLLYCGSNDINNGILEEDIIANVSQCCKIVHGLSPATVFAYFSIIKAPQKSDKWELIDRLNSAIRIGLPVSDLYVETNDVFFSDRLPVDRFFVEDGLHLTSEAYDTLSTYARPLISNWMRAGNTSN